jgi:hypothetical protein
MEPLTGRKGLIELGRQPALMIKDHAPASGGLRGMSIAITRYSNSKLSRLEVDFPDRVAGAELDQVEEPNLRRALVSTWQSARCPIPDEARKAAGIRAVDGGIRVTADSVAEAKKRFALGHDRP